MSLGIKIYKHKKLIFDESNYDKLMDDQDYARNYKGLNNSKYDLELCNDFTIKLPEGMNFIVDTDNSGLLLSPMNVNEMLNVIYVETITKNHYLDYNIDTLQEELYDDFFTVIEKDGGDGVITVLNILNVTVSYIITDSKQFKFIINTKRNLYKGYGFLTNIESYKETKKVLENWFASIRLVDNKIKDNKLIEVLSNYIYTDLFYRKKDSDNELLDVFQVDEYVNVDNKLLVPRFKDFDILNSVPHNDNIRLDSYEIRPLIMSNDIEEDFSNLSKLVDVDWIIFEQEHTSILKKIKSNYKGNIHKNKSIVNKFISDLKKSNSSIMVDRFDINGLEFTVVTKNAISKSITVMINGGNFMYFVNSFISDFSDSTTSKDIMLKWLKGIKRFEELNN